MLFGLQIIDKTRQTLPNSGVNLQAPTIVVDLLERNESGQLTP